MQYKIILPVRRNLLVVVKHSTPRFAIAESVISANKKLAAMGANDQVVELEKDEVSALLELVSEVDIKGKDAPRLVELMHALSTPLTPDANTMIIKKPEEAASVPSDVPNKPA